MNADLQDPSQRPRKRVVTHPVALTLFGALLLLNLAGLPYYLLDIAERVRSPWHDWLRPTGYIGQSAGIAAFAGFVFMWLYPLRKRVRGLAFTGSIVGWLDVHIVVGLITPILGATHAAWRFNGLIGVGYLSMFVVVLSGVTGRYIYTRIPRTRSGVELSLEEAQSRRAALVRRIAETTGIEEAAVQQALHAGLDIKRSRGLISAFLALLTADLTRFRTVRQLRRHWSEGTTGRRLDRRSLNEAVRLARQEIALTQQSRLLETTHSVFRFWHVAHLPIAITAVVAVLIHLAVALALGVTWFL